MQRLLLDNSNAYSGVKCVFLQSFPFHLGANINVPTSEARYQPEAHPMAAEAPKKDNPFAGLPLQAWAERLGERIMPAYELIKEEQKKAKLAAKPAVQTQPTFTVPHLFPITRWYVKGFMQHTRTQGQ